jgi:hypothetical protein
VRDDTVGERLLQVDTFTARWYSAQMTHKKLASLWHAPLTWVTSMVTTYIGVYNLCYCL